MPSNTIRVALVGCGFTLHTQLPAFRCIPSLQVTDLVGRDPERTQELARQHGIPRATSNLAEVLERPDVDLVCVATPPDLHHPMAMAALEAGKHVLCEKPMALDVVQAQQMCRAAECAHTMTLVDHQLRFSPGVLKLRRLLADGFIGKPLHLEAVLRVGSRLDPRRPFDWWSTSYRGGGVLGALGSHVIDLLRWLFGEVRAVLCVTNTFVNSRTPAGELQAHSVDSEDHASFWLELHAKKTVPATVTLSVVAHRGGGLLLEIFGSDGMLRLDSDGALFGCRRDPGARSSLEQPPLEDLSDVESLSAEDRRRIPDNLFARAFLLQARALAGAIAAGQTHLPGAASFEDGLAVQRVLEALQRSARSGGRVEISPTALQGTLPPLRGI